MTIGDIIVYNELSLFFEICDISPTSPEIGAYTMLQRWFNERMSKDEAIAKLDQDMKNALSKHNKTPIS